jgi:23S rRNA (uridine2552-2'-O)-methyltransferase
MRKKNRRRPDHYTKKAKAEGYAARSVYKLEAVQRRFRILKRGGRVVDLGCAPGSWSTYAASVCGPAHLVGMDITEMEAYPGTFLHGSILTIPTETVEAALAGPADVVLSDMAPFTNGNRFSDHIRQLELAQAAFDTACRLLRPGGAFVVKVFDGQDAQAYTIAVRSRFETVKRLKPPATRNKSVEFFLVATGFRAEQPG